MFWHLITVADDNLVVVGEATHVLAGSPSARWDFWGLITVADDNHGCRKKFGRGR